MATAMVNEKSASSHASLSQIESCGFERKLGSLNLRDSILNRCRRFRRQSLPHGCTLLNVVDASCARGAPQAGERMAGRYRLRRKSRIQEDEALCAWGTPRIAQTMASTDCHMTTDPLYSPAVNEYSTQVLKSCGSVSTGSQIDGGATCLSGSLNSLNGTRRPT